MCCDGLADATSRSLSNAFRDSHYSQPHTRVHVSQAPSAVPPSQNRISRASRQCCGGAAGLTEPRRGVHTWLRVRGIAFWGHRVVVCQRKVGHHIVDSAGCARAACKHQRCFRLARARHPARSFRAGVYACRHSFVRLRGSRRRRIAVAAATTTNTTTTTTARSTLCWTGPVSERGCGPGLLASTRSDGTWRARRRV